MKKIVLFSLFLLIGLAGSQTLPTLLGAEHHAHLKPFFDGMLYVCLAYIMINVGREFELDKTQWKSYTADYFIAMATAAVPWLLICGYYIFLMPADVGAANRLRSRVSFHVSQLPRYSAGIRKM